MIEQSSVQVNAGATLLLASPGTKKRHALIDRFYELLQAGVEPGKILCLTFTRSAAQEMIGRIARTARIDHTQLWPQISTFRALGLRILLTEGRLNKERPVARTATQHQTLEKVLSAPEFRNLHVDASMVMDFIANAKRNLQSPGSCLDRASQIRDCREATLIEALKQRRLAELYVRYQDALLNQSQADFDGLVYEAHRLLASDPTVLAKYQEKYEHFLIDEWQWTTPAERALTELLARKAKSFVAASDCGEMASVGSFLPEYRVEFLN